VAYNAIMDNGTRLRTGFVEPPARWSIGGLLIESLARREFAALQDCFVPDVQLRALLPFGPIEVTGCEEVASWFAAVFCGAERFEVVDGTVGEIGHRLYLRWRVRLGRDVGEPCLVEQHAFATTDDRITALDLLCSGFVPESSFATLPGASEEVPCRAWS
jgi:hypothetical protein